MDIKIPEAVGEFLFVKHIPRTTETKTSTGIIIPEAEERERNGDIVFLAQGDIVSFGSKVKDIKAKIGDRVLYNPYDAQWYYIGDDRYQAVHYTLIKAVIPCEK